jgi:uncharacterized membrane protein
MRRTPQGDERGAVAVFAAVVMSVLVLMAAIGVDLGMQRVVRRDMQAVADTMAFDMSRQLDGRDVATILASPSWSAARTRSIARNASTTLGSDPTVTVELGTVDASYAFTTATGATVPTAVRVVATASVDFAFTDGSGSATRSAVAVTRAQACYKLGSWGARLSTTANANLVYTILAAHGVSGSVAAATYQGLVGATVDLADLSTALGLASPEELATASVSLTTLLNAAADVLSSNGSTAAQVGALNAVRGGLGGLGGNSVSLAGLVDVATGAGAGLAAAVDLADLVIGSVLLADGNSAATVDLAGGLPGVTGFPTSVQLVQAAKIACGFAGSTPNSSNQVAATTTASLTPTRAVLSSLLDGLGSLTGLSVSELSAPQATLHVSSAAASSTLDAVTCGSTSRSATVGTTGGLLEASLTVPVAVHVTSLLPPFSTTVKGTIRATVGSPGSPGTVTITVPSQAYDTPYSNQGSQVTLGAPALDLPTVDSGSLSTAKATDILEAVATTVVAPLVAALNATVIGPLSDLTGLRTAGADVLLLDHPTCSSPALRG